MVRRFQILVVAVTMPFLLISCGKKEETAPAPVKKARPAQAAPAAAEAAKPELKELGPDSKERNPFLSHIVRLKGTEAARKIRGPLECCDVASFKLLALVVAPGHSSALIQAPDGKRYIVKHGDVLGSKEGKIIKIEDRYITVREYVIDEAGKALSYADVDLSLPEKEGERKR